MIAHKDAGAADQYFSIFGDLDLDLGRRLAHASEFDVIVPVNGVHNAFGRAVEVLQVYADGAKEANDVRAKSRTAGVGRAYSGKTQFVP